MDSNNLDDLFSDSDSGGDCVSDFKRTSSNDKYRKYVPSIKSQPDTSRSFIAVSPISGTKDALQKPSLHIAGNFENVSFSKEKTPLLSTSLYTSMMNIPQLATPPDVNIPLQEIDDPISKYDFQSRNGIRRKHRHSARRLMLVYDNSLTVELEAIERMNEAARAVKIQAAKGTR